MERTDGKRFREKRLPETSGLYEKGAVYASMSGSGSSVFGLFREATDLKGLFTDCFVWEGQLP